jgi:hypothetical protein
MHEFPLALDNFLLAVRSLAEFNLHLQGFNIWQKKSIFFRPLVTMEDFSSDLGPSQMLI